jgi:hypothetical protein
MLLDPHVAHLHFIDELVNGHALGPLKRIKNFQPLSAANLCKQFLVHGDRRRLTAGLYTLRSLKSNTKITQVAEAKEITKHAFDSSQFSYNSQFN